MLIDTRTLIFVLCLGNLVVGALMIAIARPPGRSSAGRLWTMAKIAQGIAFALLALRDMIPGYLSILFSNAALLTGFSLEFAASWDFLRLGAWRRTFPILAPLGVAVYFIAYAFGGDSSTRILAITLLTGVVFGLTAAGFVARWRALSIVGRAVGVTYAAVAVAALVRAVWIGQSGTTALTANVPQQILVFGTLYLFMLVSGFGFLMLGIHLSIHDVQHQEGYGGD